MTASSPMTAASHPSVSSDLLPALTNGTTAPTSPSPLSPPSRSPSLSPLPEAQPVDSSSFTKKRKAPASDASTTKKKAKGKGKENETPTKKGKDAPKAKAKDTAEKPEKGTYCHQCRTKIEPENVLRCTKLRKYTKSTPSRACNLAWCERDLLKRYDISPDVVRKRGHDVSPTELAKHDTDKEYVFACPCCLDECQNSTCRIKKGLQPLGDVVKMAAEQGVTPWELVAQINADGPEPTTKSRADMLDGIFDGELSDPDAPKTSSSKAALKKKATTAAKEPAKAKTKAIAPKKTGKETATGKKATAKGKEKEAPKKGVAKAKAETKEVVKPRYVWPKCDPPVIANIETRMSREEAEQRMYLREFVCRFRQILGIGDRSLGPLDDLDHPLSEATVRQVASALFSVIANEAEDQVYAADIGETIADLREEVRYADLARFAHIYNEAAEVLGLELPPDPAQAAKERNERAMRALLDISADEPAPTWAMETGGPSRRGASRIPPASEIVRMLIAITDFAITVDAVRYHIDPQVLYAAGDEIRKMSSGQKAEQKRWEGEKAKLNAAKLRCKNAAETKKAREKFKEREQEHFMQTKMFSLDYRANLAKKNLRFEPLGTDLDGRVYYSLTARSIDGDRYRPSFWARGVLIWGRGWEQEGDEVPNLVERWMVVNTSEGLRQLSDYLAYRWRTKVAEMEQAAEEAEKETAKGKKGGKKTPLKRTPSHNKANGSSSARSTPAQRRTSTPNGNDDGDGSYSDSDLSTPPDEDIRELLEQLDPPGYTPSMDKVKDEQFKLELAVADVGTFVEALEWRGIRA